MANVIKQKELRAYTSGMSAAVGKALPHLEEKYRLRTARNFWLILFAAIAVSFAAGVAVGETFLG